MLFNVSIGTADVYSIVSEQASSRWLISKGLYCLHENLSTRIQIPNFVRVVS